MFVDHHPTPVVVPIQDQITLGRYNPDSRPDEHIDLARYRAGELGVSRIHALIRRQIGGLQIEDLNSSNGTFVNGAALQANEPYPLKSGDEIRLGNLPLRLYFE